MFGLGFPELIVILVVALFVFGPSKLPELGSGLGQALRDFQKAFTGHDDEKDAKPPIDEKPRPGGDPPNPPSA